MGIENENTSVPKRFAVQPKDVASIRGPSNDPLCPDAILTLQQAAAVLRISRQHLSKVLAGRVPGVAALRHIHVGRRILTTRSWMAAWLDESSGLWR